MKGINRTDGLGMDAIREQVKQHEKDIQELKGMWKLLSKIEKQNAVILSRLEEGHPCKQEIEIQSLKDFKNSAEKQIENSIGKNQAIIMIVFAALLSGLMGYVIRGF